MLLSMTGFGESRTRTDALDVACEIRSVNNRYLKVTVRCPESWSAFEGEIEKLIRSRVRRGTVQVSIRVRRTGDLSGCGLNTPVLEAYYRQLCETAAALGLPAPESVDAVLPLPGVVDENAGASADDADWPAIQNTVTAALDKLLAYRRTEGKSMEEDLRKQGDTIRTHLETVIARAPEIASMFRQRIHERVSKVLSDTDVSIDSADLLREVSIFADRCDINEEIMRLRTHLDQFDSFVNQSTSQGRKLEFLSQEVFRETNTIGAKASDVEIAHSVVEMKAAIEKTREILQNVE